jgi:hypothetical protein
MATLAQPLASEYNRYCEAFMKSHIPHIWLTPDFNPVQFSLPDH